MAGDSQTLPVLRLTCGPENYYERSYNDVLTDKPAGVEVTFASLLLQNDNIDTYGIVTYHQGVCARPSGVFSS